MIKKAITQQGIFRIYIVQQGDTLFSIAVEFNTTVEALLEINDIPNPDLIFVGQRLFIPIDEIPSPSPYPVWYTVQKGDTLFKIARRYNISLNHLIQANPQIQNPNLIMPGQIINIPLY